VRATAYWPKSRLHPVLERNPQGVPVTAYKWGARERPVFWVTATQEEVEEHIVPHMVNTIIIWKQILKECAQREDWRDGWVDSNTQEFSFFVPWIPRITDEPWPMSKCFAYTGMNASPPWDIGPEEGRYNPLYGTQGFEFNDFSHETFADMRDLLKKQGEWKDEMRSWPE
jgi:hypothetical protein